MRVARVTRCVLWTSVALAGAAALSLVGVAAAAYRKAPEIVAALERSDALPFDPGSLPPARVCVSSCPAVQDRIRPSSAPWFGALRWTPVAYDCDAAASGARDCSSNRVKGLVSATASPWMGRRVDLDPGRTLEGQAVAHLHGLMATPAGSRWPLSNVTIVSRPLRVVAVMGASRSTRVESLVGAVFLAAAVSGSGRRFGLGSTAAQGVFGRAPADSPIRACHSGGGVRLSYRPRQSGPTCRGSGDRTPVEAGAGGPTRDEAGGPA